MSDSTLILSLAGFAFMMTVIWGGPLIRILKHFKVGKIIRVEEPSRHFTKMGTPTMGGIMIILPVLLITVLLNAGAALVVAGKAATLKEGVDLAARSIDQGRAAAVLARLVAESNLQAA